MLDTYGAVLNGVMYAEAFKPGNFTFETYEGIYELIKGFIKEDNRIPKEGFQFGMLPNVPAKDVFNERVENRPLLGYKPRKFQTRPISYIDKLEDPIKSVNLYCLATVLEKKVLISSAIATFNQAIVAAQTRREQLLAITRFLRFLHITHYFTDGNGRMHCYIMLPRLLLQYGFGPTLRLGDACAVDTLFSLFNGCFTLDEIVTFLWNAQQLDANFEPTG